MMKSKGYAMSPRGVVLKDNMDQTQNLYDSLYDQLTLKSFMSRYYDFQPMLQSAQEPVKIMPTKVPTMVSGKDQTTTMKGAGKIYGMMPKVMPKPDSGTLAPKTLRKFKKITW